MSADVLVAGVGNIFLGDDGFGPEVVRHLRAPEQPPLPGPVRLVDYGIRGLHLSYDLLEGYSALIIVDAMPGLGQPGEIQVVAVDPDDVPATDGQDPHSMDPMAVLSGLPSLGGALPPTYVVGAQPSNLEEGIGLSDPLRAAVPVAGAAIRELLATRPWATGHEKGTD
ncbi:MAG TPA: hydrogenase maturation protease [Propionibacteriaceae bacterium]|nr:hydrogenase maturation protease [Propionibacteriaceae bacterium]